MRKIYILLLLTVFLVGADYPKNDTALKTTLFKNLCCDQVIKTSIYDTCYDYTYKAPIAVAYVVKQDTIDKINLQRRYMWREYSGIPKEYRQRNIDYYRSGFDRGHLAKDSWFDFDKTSLKTTYYLSINTTPMLPHFNRHKWSKLERRVNSLVREKGDMYVINIIEYNKIPNNEYGNGKLNNNITIPTTFYKIIYKYNPFYIECYKINQFDYNRKDSYLKYKVDCNDLTTKRVKHIKLNTFN